MPLVRMEMREDYSPDLKRKLVKKSHESHGRELAYDRVKDNI